VSRPLHLGYNPPSGQRGLERVDPATFAADLDRALEIMAPVVDSLWISDHFMTGDRFRLECWTLLTWVASRYPGLSIGPIVAAQSYRHPPLFAKMIASLDSLMASSAAAAGVAPGRPILGYGAGWAEDEYRGYGFDFPPTRTRIAQLDEALTVMRLLWAGGPVDFEGRFFRLEGATCVPAPSPRPLIMVGGEGPTTMAVAARQADWWNMLHRPEPRRSEVLARLDAVCEAQGRDPASLRRAMYLTVFLDRDAAAARSRAIDRTNGEAPPFAGSPAELVETLGAFADQGVDAFNLVFPGWPDLTDLELFAAEVRPAFTRSPAVPPPGAPD
jgi:alkanesulfonate monooxygenase SsuD/methylene tetrahydromethanopterin reductase-like flavin-dependent oxidoreductase (luciferase family)